MFWVQTSVNSAYCSISERVQTACCVVAVPVPGPRDTNAQRGNELHLYLMVALPIYRRRAALFWHCLAQKQSSECSERVAAAASILPNASASIWPCVCSGIDGLIMRIIECFALCRRRHIDKSCVSVSRFVARGAGPSDALGCCYCC